MSDTIFLRLLPHDDKAAALAAAVDVVREGGDSPDVQSVDPTSFRQVPGSPFAYWVGERAHSIFTELPAFEGEGRRVCSGPDTGQDFRCIRAYWEVPPARIGAANKWALHAKGGDYSPYYADLHLVLLWGSDGSYLKQVPSVNIRNPAFYFHPGLTWSLRTQLGLSFRALPDGSIFGHKGPAAFVPKRQQLFPLLGVVNSRAFRGAHARVVRHVKQGASFWTVE